MAFGVCQLRINLTHMTQPPDILGGILACVCEEMCISHKKGGKCRKLSLNRAYYWIRMLKCECVAPNVCVCRIKCYVSHQVWICRIRCVSITSSVDVSHQVLCITSSVDMPHQVLCITSSVDVPHQVLCITSRSMHVSWIRSEFFALLSANN